MRWVSSFQTEILSYIESQNNRSQETLEVIPFHVPPKCVIPPPKPSVLLQQLIASCTEFFAFAAHFRSRGCLFSFFPPFNPEFPSTRWEHIVSTQEILCWTNKWLYEEPWQMFLQALLYRVQQWGTPCLKRQLAVFLAAVVFRTLFYTQNPALQFLPFWCCLLELWGIR